MMLLEWWCGVQQDHGLRDETLPEPTGVGAEVPVTPAGHRRRVKRPWLV